MNFEHVILEPEQEDLFIRIVEARRRCPRDQWDILFMIKGFHELIITSKDCEDYRIGNIVPGDIDELIIKGFLRVINETAGEKHLSIPAEGYQYYEWLIKQQGKPVERIEKQTFRYLDFEDFRRAYSDAYRKIKQAEEILWLADKEEQFTTIGHLCREAVQDFADGLYTKVTGTAYDGPKTQTHNRIEALITGKCDSKKVRKYLRALFDYWKAVGGLIQKQEHRAEKEKEQLTWEDSRRVVFQTVNVMAELHKTFNDTK